MSKTPFGAARIPFFGKECWERDFKAFVVLPGGDVVNLIKIDQWDFRWQTMYQFKSLLHLPKGSVILAEATYDNTAENPENPSRPPRDVGYG